MVEPVFALEGQPERRPATSVPGEA
jgi:hypothetical protein